MTVGQAYLDLYSFPTTTLRGYWIPVIVLACYYWVLTVFCFLSTTYVRHDEVIRTHFGMTYGLYNIASRIIDEMEFKMGWEASKGMYVDVGLEKL